MIKYINIITIGLGSWTCFDVDRPFVGTALALVALAVTMYFIQSEYKND